MQIEVLEAYSYKEEIGELFREYTDMLVEGDPRFQIYLDLQNYLGPNENLLVQQHTKRFHFDLL